MSKDDGVLTKVKKATNSVLADIEGIFKPPPSDEESNRRLIEVLFKAVQDSDGLENLKVLFERHKVNASRYDSLEIYELVEQIRKDGSNDIMVVVRGGKGVNYDEIVRDVADKVGVDYKKEKVSDESELELLIVQHLVKQYFSRLTPEQKQDFEQALRKLGKEYEDFWKQFLEAKGTALLAVIQIVGRPFLFNFLAAILRQFLVIASARSLPIGLSAWQIPFVNIALGVWLVIDLLGPAYRKTVPTVFQIASLRIEFGEEKIFDGNR